MRLVDLSSAAGISTSLLSRVETGRRRPHTDLVQRLASVLHLEPEALSGHPGERDRHTSDNHWPMVMPHVTTDVHQQVITVADIALTTAMRETLESIDSASAAERFRACKNLAALASRPLETILRVSHEDSDPIVREAAGQLLATLSQSYCEV
jgi:transcriptional regulator with XRE-family HTH domain